MGWLRRPAVLTYHGVDRVGGDLPFTDDPNRLLVHPDHLGAHIRYLKRRGYAFTTASALVGSPPQPGTAVLTFDDGFANWVSEALPVLERERVPATFYVCPGWYDGQHPDITGRGGRLISEADVRRLYEAGMDVGSHALTHPDLRSLDDAELARQLTESKAAVEATTATGCATLAYPFGLYDDRVERAAADAGYALAFAWVPGPWSPYAAPRMPAPVRHGARRLALKLIGVRRFWTS